MKKESALSLWENIKYKALQWLHDNVVIGMYTNQELEHAYNEAHKTIREIEDVIKAASNKKLITVIGPDGEDATDQLDLSPERLEHIFETCKQLLKKIDVSTKRLETEIAKRSLTINKLPDGKYYFIQKKVAKMNKTIRYSSRNTDRFIRINRVVAAKDPIDILERALSMSENDRKEYIKNFVREHGLKEVFNIVKSAISAITSAKSPVTAGVHDQGYMQNRKKDIVSDEENDEKPSAKEQSQPMKSRLKTVLEKLGDWSILLTFFLMWAAISTSDFHTLVLKQEDLHAEIKAFLIASGAAFMAWAFNYLRSLLK